MSTQTKPENVIDVIDAEHREVDHLLVEMEKSEPGKRADLFARIAEALTLHSYAEESTVYRLVEKDEKGEARQFKRDHAQVEAILGEMTELSRRGTPWDQHEQQLKQAVTSHVEEERANLFPELRRRFDSDRLVQLAQDFEEAKREYRERAKTAA